MREYLTCYIPHLKPDDHVVVPVHDFQSEINSYRGPVVLREKLMHVALDDGSFSRSKISDHQHFVEVVPWPR